MDAFFLSLRHPSDVAQAVSAVVAACTFLVAVVSLWKSRSEYKRGNALKRFKKYQQMRLRYEKEGAVKEVAVLLANDDDKLSNLDGRIKEEFLGFYEDIAIMNRSDLISDEITHYMFGYYALKAYRSTKFRKGLDLDGPYWVLFMSLCQRLETQEKKIRQGKINVSRFSKRMRF